MCKSEPDVGSFLCASSELRCNVVSTFYDAEFNFNYRIERERERERETENFHK